MTTAARLSWFMISFYSTKGIFFHFVQCTEKPFTLGREKRRHWRRQHTAGLVPGTCGDNPVRGRAVAWAEGEGAWALSCSSGPGTAWRGRRAACEMQAEACGVIPVTFLSPLPRALRAHRSRRNHRRTPGTATPGLRFGPL